jgi:hypothetical protein
LDAPPLTVAHLPDAVFPYPPPIVEHLTDAVLFDPPLTVEEQPDATFIKIKEAESFNSSK